MLFVDIVISMLIFGVILGFLLMVGLLLRAAMHGHTMTTPMMGQEVKLLPYTAKQYFFTRSEQIFFDLLNSRLDALSHTVFPKVRLGDFIQVENLKDNYGSWAKIRSRHVDFLVWDLKNQKIVLAIELDGNSHNSHKAKQIDIFKDDVFKHIEVPLHRIRVGSNFEEEIEKLLMTL